MANKLVDKKYHFIYKTTNVLNGTFYIGMHSTNNLEDGYLGSGTYLKRSIRKYGRGNFKREILEYCEEREKLVKREIEVVNSDLVKESLCMNLQTGGGNIELFSSLEIKRSDEWKLNQSKAKKGRVSIWKGKTLVDRVGEVRAKEIRNKISNDITRAENISKKLSGRVFTEEHKKNLRKPKRKILL